MEQKQEEIYQALVRTWNIEYTTPNLQNISEKDCFLQYMNTLGKELTNQLSTESSKIGQTLIRQTLTNIHYMINDLLEVRANKIVEAARELKKIDESILFSMEISYYRSLYTAFKGYSRIRNSIVDGQELKNITPIDLEIKEPVPDISTIDNGSESNVKIEKDEISSEPPEIYKEPLETVICTTPIEQEIKTPISIKQENSKQIERKFDGNYTMVRILKDIPALVGEDFEIYGPFQAEDITNLPNRNAQILIEEKVAKQIGESG